MGNKFSDTCIFLTSYGFFDFRFGSCTRSDTFEGRGLVEAEVSLSKGQSSKRKQNGVKWGNFMRTISNCIILISNFSIYVVSCIAIKTAS